VTQGEFDDGLLVPASKEGWNAAKVDRRELQYVPHSEEHSARNHRSLILRLDPAYHRSLIHRVPKGKAQ